MKKRKSLSALLLVALFIAVCGPAAAIEAGGVAIHGFVSQGYLKTDDVNYLAETKKGTYQFNEAGINFNYTLNKLRVGAQIFSRDLGELGNNDIVLDWAVGEYKAFDELGLRAGRIKMPYGLYNQGRDVDLLRTPVLLPSGIYEEGARDMLNAIDGFGVFGAIDALAAGDFEYEIFAGASEMGEDSLFVRGTLEAYEKGIVTALPGFISGSVDDANVDSDYMIGGAIRWGTPLPGLRLGTTYFTGEAESRSKLTLDVPNIPAGAFFAGIPGVVPPVPAAAIPAFSTMGDITTVNIIDDSWVYSAEFTWENLTMACEYMLFRLSAETKITGLDLTPLAALGITDLPPIEDQTNQSTGWYASASYQFTDWFTLGLYYSEYYSDRDDKKGQRYMDEDLPASYAWQKEWVPTLRFDPVQNWVIKGEVHFIDGSARCYNFNNPYGRDDNWHLYAVKTSFSF